MRSGLSMKFFIMALCAIITSAAIGQKQTRIDSTERLLSDQYKKFKEVVKEKRDPAKEDKVKKEAENTLKKDKDFLVVETYRYLDQTLKESEKTNRNLEEQYPYKPGEMNLLPLLEEATGPITQLQQAGQTDMDAYYKPFLCNLLFGTPNTKHQRLKWNA